MKSSLWFEAAMLALILVVSIVNVVANESERRHLASDSNSTVQLKTPAHYSMTNAYL